MRHHPPVPDPHSVSVTAALVATWCFASAAFRRWRTRRDAELEAAHDIEDLRSPAERWLDGHVPRVLVVVGALASVTAVAAAAVGAFG